MKLAIGCLDQVVKFSKNVFKSFYRIPDEKTLFNTERFLSKANGIRSAIFILGRDVAGLVILEQPESDALSEKQRGVDEADDAESF